MPDDALTPASVPDPQAPLDELLRFGHGYHAYRVAGSLPRVSGIALDLHDRWTNDHDADADATLDDPLPQLRIALFSTVRALEHDPIGAPQHDPVRAPQHDPASAPRHDPASAPRHDRARAPRRDRARGSEPTDAPAHGRSPTDAETWVRVLVRSVGAAVARGPGR